MLAITFWMAGPSTAAQAADPQLVKLRHQLALYYFEPSSYMALAKYFWQRGDRLLAFYILEYARHERLTREEFDRAFSKAFGGDQTPNKQDFAVLDPAFELERRGSLDKAEESYVKAAELSPRSMHVQTYVGRFFLKVRRNNQRALEYYLNAYFLNPHAVETEFVEARIRSINYEEASFRYRLLNQQNTSLREILQDPNPTVLVLALMQVNKTWSPDYLDEVLKCMEHDEEHVRWLAMTAISRHVDKSFDATLQMLLEDKDLRKRGLAAYIAAHLWKQKSFPILRKMLSEQSQLLRFDAISALAIEGASEGRRIIRAHRRSESNRWLLRLIDKAIKEESSP